MSESDKRKTILSSAFKSVLVNANLNLDAEEDKRRARKELETLNLTKRSRDFCEDPAFNLSPGALKASSSSSSSKELRDSSDQPAKKAKSAKGSVGIALRNPNALADPTLRSILSGAAKYKDQQKVDDWEKRISKLAGPGHTEESEETRR